ncbi:hypothetical protein BS47DRAFT_1262992, partial [Hydnum rufescens UP504]
QDDVLCNAALFNHDASIYLEMKEAGSVGNWGQIKMILPNIICIFQGSGSTNYAVELLHLLQNLKYSWTPVYA